MKFQQRTLFIARIAILISLTAVIQIAGFPQPITGPLINAMLFITTTLIGAIAGIALGCLTPLFALIRGQLPMVLAPMVPFIMAGNIALVVVYYIISYKVLNFVKPMNTYVAILLAAVAKFLLLFLSVKILLPVIFGHAIPDKFAVMMTTPQLITALVGGIIAFILIKLINRAGLWQ